MSCPCYLACFSFDGEFKVEKNKWDKNGKSQPPGPFPTHQDAWDHANDMGSKWYFYPFYLLLSPSQKTIVDAPESLQNLTGKRVSTVIKLFKEISERPENKNATPDSFANVINAEALIPGSTKPINI